MLFNVFIFVLGGMRPDNSSIDSLERDMYGELDSSPNLVKSHLSPSNLSRDSGLTLSDAQLYDEDGSTENLTDRKNYNRSVSQYIDRDSDKSKYSENVVSRSYDNAYEIQNPKPPPRKHKKREYSNEKENLTKGVRNSMVQSYSAEGYSKFKRNSTESLRSLEDEPEDQFAYLRHAEFGTLVKSSSGAHLYYDENNKETSNKNLHYVSEIEIQTQCPPNGGNGKLMRQASVTDSNPPTSPQSRLSCGSSLDSGIPHSSSCSSFMHGQLSQESDLQFSVWSTSEERFRESQDDASLNSQYSSARRSSNSKKSVNYLVSPPISPKTFRKVMNSDSKHKSLSVRRSFPMEYSIPSKGSGSDSYKEAEDIIKPRYQLSAYEFHEKDSDHLSPILASKYGTSASANDVRSNIPLKAINKYGLGTSPPPGVILKLHQKQQKREIAPMRASHDSAILSQVRRNSTDSSGSDHRRDTEYHHSELNVGKLSTNPHPLMKSDSDGDINRTLSNSPNRPDRPPSYDEACQRTFMIKHGIPLEISEQDSEKQKEASLRAKQLYEESLRKYMEEHLNSPSVQSVDRREVTRKEEVIMEQEEGDSDTTGSSEEEIMLKKSDPKKIYEDSMKAYEQMKSNNGPSEKSSGNKSALDSSHLSVNLHRSFSDSSDHMNKAAIWSRRSPNREKSPLTDERRSNEVSRNSSPSTQLNYSSSSVSNSSSDTVTENQQIPPYRHDRSESSPVASRHYFPKASDNFAQNFSAQSQQRSSNEQYYQSRDSSVESKYSVKSRDSSLSRDRGNSYSRDFEQRETTVIVDSSKPRFFTASSRTSSLDSEERTPNRNTSANVAPNKFESKNSIVWKSKANRDSALTWSVKNLRSVYDQSNNSGGSSPTSSQTNESRPPPPPYQPPPPFCRDTARMSSSSNSSCSSSNTDNSANIPQTKTSLSHRRLGGPQARDSFSDDSDTSSRSSGHLKNSTNNSSSDHETWTYLDTEVTFV